MKLSPDIATMGGPDFSTPRGMGAFIIALDPDAFAGAELVRAGITRYLELLRASPAQPGRKVMAPGDREWAVALDHRKNGITLDPVTLAEFADLASSLTVDPIS